MNSQTTIDITGFRSYLPDAFCLRFDEQLSVRAIAQQLGLSHPPFIISFNDLMPPAFVLVIT